MYTDGESKNRLALLPCDRSARRHFPASRTLKVFRHHSTCGRRQWLLKSSLAVKGLKVTKVAYPKNNEYGDDSSQILKDFLVNDQSSESENIESDDMLIERNLYQYLNPLTVNIWMTITGVLRTLLPSGINVNDCNFL